MTHFNYFCYASLRHAPRLGARPAFPRYAGEPLGARPVFPATRGTARS